MIRTAAAGLAAAATLFCALPAAAADFQVIHYELDVARPAAAAWAVVGDYCVIKDWFKLDTCAYTTAARGVGSVRRLNGTIDEVMVSQTPLSYGYYQTAGNMAANSYHGFMELRPTGAGASRIYYTLVYDQAPLADDAARAATRTRLEGRFKAAVDTMKTMIEAK